MRIYVDKLPKNCADCPFYKLDTYVDVYGYQTNSHECVLDGSMLTNSCPLQSLTDHTKQVRKEVVQEIKDKLKLKERSHPEDDFEIDYDFYYKEDVEEVLDQLQGEDK